MIWAQCVWGSLLEGCSPIFPPVLCHGGGSVADLPELTFLLHKWDKGEGSRKGFILSCNESCSLLPGSHSPAPCQLQSDLMGCAHWSRDFMVLEFSVKVSTLTWNFHLLFLLSRMFFLYIDTAGCFSPHSQHESLLWHLLCPHGSGPHVILSLIIVFILAGAVIAT